MDTVGGTQVGYDGSGREQECYGRGCPMDLDTMGYAGYATSTFKLNVQFDRHPTEGGGLGIRR